VGAVPGTRFRPGSHELKRKSGEDPMNTKILAIAGTVLLSIMAAGECQAQSRSLEVNVPFTFEVGNKTLPAGSYRAESIPTGAGSVTILRNNRGDVRMPISTTATASKSGTAASALVFHRYGTHYFLAQIRTGDGHAREVFASQQEKELARSEPKIEVALQGRTPGIKP
jgi:hypothetical protein